MISNHQNIPRIEFKVLQMLAMNLPHTIEELDHHLGDLVLRAGGLVLRVSTPHLKRVAKTNPLLLNQHFKSFKGTVVRVKEELSECADLGSAIPPV